MPRESVEVQQLGDQADAVIARVEGGEVFRVTRRGVAVALIVPTAITPHLTALVAAGTVRPPSRPRYLPKPVRPRGGGASAAAFIVEGRR